MHETGPTIESCAARSGVPVRSRERAVLAVVVLTAVMTVVEISVGYARGSMALLADGWHMATHVGALAIATAAYAVSRRFAGHPAFAFGTGKVEALAGYSSAVALAAVAVAMAGESVMRLLRPASIDFRSSLPVACVGLVVNLVSVWILHGRDEDDHGHAEHDHNHGAALVHVMADTFTSALAIVALIAGRFLGWLWLDAVTGIVGGVVILKWGADLARRAGSDLLDLGPQAQLTSRIRSTLEAIDDVRVSDLHVWPLGRGARSCVVTVVSAQPRPADEYRDRLAEFGLAHLTVEVRRCVDGHAGDEPGHAAS